MAPLLRRMRYRLEWLAVRGAMWFVPKLGRRLLLALADALGSAAWALDARGRSTAEENLRFALGEGSPGSLTVYRSVARTFLELFWTPNLTEPVYRQIVETASSPEGLPPLPPGRPTIRVTPHFGNFEWLTHEQAYDGKKLTILAQDFKNPLLTELFTALRSHTGHALVSREGGVLRLMRHLKKGGDTAFLTDLTVPPDQAATVVRCFGGDTCATAAHVELARRTGAVIEPHVMLPLPGGRYRAIRGAVVEVDGKTNAEVAQACWDFYEPFIHSTPEAWLWMYKHWRFLPAGTPPEAFPPYANRSKKFDALAARERA